MIDYTRHAIMVIESYNGIELFRLELELELKFLVWNWNWNLENSVEFFQLWPQVTSIEPIFQHESPKPK